MINNEQNPQLTIPRVTSSVSYDLFGNPVLDAKRTMSDYFGVAPFSILNTTDKSAQESLVKQALDLAKLSQNLLKGEELTAFVKRSFELIK